MPQLHAWLALVASVVVVACTPSPGEAPRSTPVPTVDLPITFSGERAFDHIETQMAFGPRPTGTPAHRQTGDYILDSLVAAGWQTREQPFMVEGVEARNLVGMSRESPSADPLIILGAHYDTRLLSDSDPDRERAGEPVPGANDGASGVAVLLELALALDLDTIGAEVALVFFDAEDNGRIGNWDWIVGSRHYAENMTRDPSLVIIVDMIGDADQQLYYERTSNTRVTETLWQVAAELGYAEQFVPEFRYAILDDHTPFLERGIPAVDIIDFDYPYWHTTADTLDKVSADSLERVGRTVEVYLEEQRWKSDGLEGSN